MTQQYEQQNINSNPTGSRNVDQTNIDASLTVPSVVLTNDDGFVVLGDDGVIGVYRANLPDVRENPGREFTLKNDGAVVVTIGTIEIDGVASGQTIDGVATMNMSAGDTAILRAEPAGTPAAPATNWFIIVAPAGP